jgi:FAS-associated factor 2
VFCHNESSFENPDGPFDLIQTFPKLSLKDKKDQVISDVFQESQMEQLIVTEE